MEGLSVMAKKLALVMGLTHSYEDTITYKGEAQVTYTSAGQIAFVNGSPSTITDTANGFVTAGFEDGDFVDVVGSSSNDGLVKVTNVAAGTLTLDYFHDLTNETAGAGDVTLVTPLQSALYGGDVTANIITSQITDADEDTKVEVERGFDDDTVRFLIAGTDEAQIDSNGLTLKAGASVNELSTDGTMAGDSDDAVPTEKAVKTYVDTEITNMVESDAVIVDHTLTRGDGGARKIQDTGITCDDSDNLSGIGTISSGALTATSVSQFGDATNKMTVAADGEIGLEGTARVAKSVWMPAGAVRGVGANPASESTNATGFVILEFADAADDYAQANIKVPADMDFTADSTICIGWSVPNLSANMTWGYGYLISAEDEDTEAAATTGTTQVTSSATADGLNVDTIVTISGSTITASDVCIHLYFYRDVSEDTYGNPVDVHGVAFRYTANKLGTAT